MHYVCAHMQYRQKILCLQLVYLVREGYRGYVHRQRQLKQSRFTGSAYFTVLVDGLLGPLCSPDVAFLKDL